MNKNERRWGIAAVACVLLVVALSAGISVGLPIIAVVTQCPLPYLQQGSGQSSSAQAEQQPRGGLQWGMYQTDAPASLATLDQLSGTLARKPAILHWYLNWGASLSATDLQAARNAGATPMITWEAHDQPLPGIAAGQFDSVIDGFASTARGAGGPVYVRIFHEFNDPPGYPWSQAGKDGSELVAGWRHTVERMRADGATNVQWVWNPDGDSNNNRIPPNSYPGDQYVDFAGFDWYDNSNTPFDQDYANVARFTSKPQIVGELGARSAASITAVQQLIQGGKVPKLRALVWFDEGSSRLEANAGVEQAVKALLQAAPSGQGGSAQVLGMGASSEQTQNAAAIIAEVKKEGMPQQAAVIAIAAAQAESGLRNLDYGDRDSIGLFQQRPSQGWGTPQRIMDPAYATSQFLAHLKALGNWASMSVMNAAQAVQRSANPAAYANAVGTGTQLVQQLWGGTQAGQQSQPQPQGQQPGFVCQFQSRPQPEGQPQTKPIPGSGLPFPIPAIVPPPGWKQPIPVPAWPAGLPGTRVNPPAITPQCVAGALWAWATAHLTDPAFAHPPPMSVQSAYQMTAEAQRAGFKMDSTPHVGDMVVFRNGSFYGPNGHVALVIAASGTSYLVAEQNFVNAVDDLGPHWGTWDIRSIGWPDAQASGFIAAPPA